MIRTFTAATTDSMTARMGARRLMRPHSMVATHLSHGSCAGINEQYRRADSISAAMCQIVDHLSPEIVRANLVGQQPVELTPTRLVMLSRDLPHDWQEQRRLLGFAPA